jgi:hypothetical protein
VDKAKEEFIAFEYFPATGFWQILEVEGQAWSPLVSGWTQPTPQDVNASIMVAANGRRISAFHDGVFLGYADSSRSGSGTINYISLRSNGASIAQVDILKIGFWNLDTVEWMTDDWITARPETVVIDSFTGQEGMQFSPSENEKYENGQAVLFALGSETRMTRDDLQGKDVALEVSFILRKMPTEAYLIWVLGENTSTGHRLEFNYRPDGSWQICKAEDNQWLVLSSGTAQPTPEGSAATIMVVEDTNGVRVYLNQAYIGNADIDRSGAGTHNALAILEKANQYAQVDVYLIRFWDLGSVEQASGEESASLSETINILTDGRLPDFQDDFSSATLQEYWSNDQGAQEATLQDGALRFGNKNLIGQDTLNKMNYILQVDLRFGGIYRDENFVYGIRTTEFQNGKYGSEYLLNINPSSGEWAMNAIMDPHGQWTGIQKGNLGLIEAGRWYELGIVVNTDSIQTFWDDQLFFTQDSVVLYGLVNQIGLDPWKTEESATLDIDNWRFWDLGTPAFMRNDWITEIAPTVAEDNFVAGDGWQLSGVGEINGSVKMSATNENETGLTREDIHATNFALEVSFSPQDMPEPSSLVLFLRKDTNTGESLEFEYFSTTGFWQIRWIENKNYVVLGTGWTQPTPQDNTGTIMVLVDGERVSAFYGDAFLGYAESSLSGTGTWNELVIRSNGAPYAQVDISQIRFWDLDTPELMIPERIYLRTPSVEEDYFVQGEGWRFDPSENEKYEDGRAVLFTDASGTSLWRDDLTGTDFAMEVTFIPRDMIDPAALEWGLRENTLSNDSYFFEFNPGTGSWLIAKHEENEGWSHIASGSTQPVPQDTMGTIMVMVNADQVSVFQNQVLIDTVNIDRSGAGTMYPILILLSNIPNNTSVYARVDITNIKFWKLDQ